MVYVLNEAKAEIDNLKISHITSVSVEENDDSSSVVTSDGDVILPSNNTGGTITIEGLELPDDVEELVELEKLIKSRNIDKATFSGIAFTQKGEPYQRTITGSNGFILRGSEWTPTDGVTRSFDCKFNKITFDYKKA
ncbi:hypothetical protein MBBAR_6c01280 [Methanobrevibacter arboriphilus JCM 13429 = DSM 1125]|uniref:Uncharacterized protein n=1 Tax=Methanobrevibacter arboriphilus JCM 13429 = DSM 1125 TaxID=1300164 RepID=A0A1V6N2T6_METAZ|nr:hypothetical protein [Methanobrevibacter arboriphilus]OQD59018.1 hypothetical protein MBBAR_6c01280 [Methanobrevibacter arboriphilus JCM 13429 = DSM 1125]